MSTEKSKPETGTLSRRRFITNAVAGTAVVATGAKTDELREDSRSKEVIPPEVGLEDTPARYGSELGNIKRPC